MTGLMFLFLLISLVYMVQAQVQAARAKDIALYYDRTRQDLYRDLDREFHNDFPRWGAHLYKQNLSIRFTEPHVLFPTGSAQLQPSFEAILENFFPRYIRILTGPEYRNDIREVRIEGYTSTIWHPGASIQQAYIGNMELSQSRTRSVLQYVLTLAPLQNEQPWLMQHVTANGLSFSHLIKAGGVEEQQQSQRVEFRVVTDADAQIQRILKLPR